MARSARPVIPPLVISSTRYQVSAARRLPAPGSITNCWERLVAVGSGSGPAGLRRVRRTGSRPGAGHWRRRARWSRPADRRSPAARKLVSSWLVVRAPRMVELTPGRAVTQAIATSAMDTPRCSAICCTASMTLPGAVGCRVGRRPPCPGPGPRRASWRRPGAGRAGTCRTASHRRAGSRAAGQGRSRGRRARSPTRSRGPAGCTAAGSSPARPRSGRGPGARPWSAASQ